MLENAKVATFIGATDRERARAFFGGTLGLKLLHEDSFALVFDAHGVSLRVSMVKELTPQSFIVLGWEVPDIHSTVRELRASVIEFPRLPGLQQDDLGIWSPVPTRSSPGSRTPTATR